MNEACKHCKATDGFKWHWSKLEYPGGKGWAECSKCGGRN